MVERAIFGGALNSLSPFSTPPPLITLDAITIPCALCVFVWFLRVKYLRVSCWRVYKRAAIVYIYKMLYGFFPPFIFQIVRTHKQRSWWWWCERDQRSLRIVFLHPGWESDAFRKVLTRSQLSCGRRLYKWLRQPENMAVGELGGNFISFVFVWKHFEFGHFFIISLSSLKQREIK